MRINFKTASVPLRAAKRLKSQFKIKESMARDWTAYVFGYRNWYELLNELGRSTPSPFDEDCSAQELGERRRYQADRLWDCLRSYLAFPQPIDAVHAVAAWQPSASQPNEPSHPKLSWSEANKEEVFRAMIGYDMLTPLSTLGPDIVAQTPLRAKDWMAHDVCSVSRKLMRTGDEVEKSFARQILKAAHQKGNQGATLKLAVSLTLGEGGPPDKPRAAQLFQTLIDDAQTAPHVRIAAQDGLATLAGNGEGWPENTEKAMRIWEAKALAGDAEYAYRVGLAYDPFKPLFRLVPPDAAKSAKSYRLAAKQGHVPSASNLGWVLTDNRKLAQYYGEEEHWFEFAANSGDKFLRKFKAQVACEVDKLVEAAEGAELAVLEKLLKKMPAELRRDARNVIGLGEMVPLPHYHWVQTSTGFIFWEQEGEMERCVDSFIATDVMARYPKDKSDRLGRLEWTLEMGELFAHILPHESTL